MLLRAARAAAAAARASARRGELFGLALVLERLSRELCRQLISLPPLLLDLALDERERRVELGVR